MEWQRADLGIECSRVHGGHLRGGGSIFHCGPDRAEPQAEPPQRDYQFHSGQRAAIIQTVAGRAARRLRYDAGVGP